MKKFAFAVSALAAGVVGASAADLPLKAKPIVAAGLDWSGVYIGAHAGYGGGMTDWMLVEPGQDFVARGALVGGQIGINKQLGSVVFGLELDGSWADVGGSSSFRVGGPALPIAFDSTSTSKLDSLATFAGRAGIAADRWFVFAKAGLSVAQEKHTSLLVLSTAPAGVVTQTTSLSGKETRYAPMLGFGAEYALSGPWSILAEYNYHHFGTRNVRQTGTVNVLGTVAPAVIDNRIEQAVHVAKLGVNYRFGNVSPDPSFAPVPAASGTNWTGAYVGAQGGYGWGQTRWPDIFGVVPPAPFGELPRYDNSGWIAGGTVGVNAQTGRFVFGVEGELLATGIKGNLASSVNLPGFLVVDSTYSSKIDWLALASARAGFVVGDRLMLYGKGGLAIAEERHTATAIQIAPLLSANLSGKAVHTGAVVGAGGEYAFAPNWSVKAEYDYIKMFAQQVQFTANMAGGLFGPGATTVQAANRINQDLHLVKFGVNYHFNPRP